ncbi:TIGR02186 family protein [Phenylobacterium sp. J367]|uniref:TIGR02186 family protein n=1 Tax=Phenylobacterium sp. J367 TaxID=2898435 RepID=UPI0021513679|nr:TIGR02186 family protein [Phenylobacterium sp. J367]MCR5878759.1 TIGR02186 family protein [Phenylobacterium sp. J367]
MAVDAAPPVAKTPAAVSAALTETEVRVASNFRGARIVLYGAVFGPSDTPGDVVVIVRGPEQPVRIARKVRVAGLWLNSRPVVFHGAPGFYIAASTRPLDDIARFRTLRELNIGVDHLPIRAPAEQRVETRYGVRDVVVSSLGPDYLLWRQAVVRLKEKTGLYAADERGVRFVDRGLFRAEIALPAQAPTGTYEADIILFRNGEPISVKHRTLTVQKVGIERTLYLWAHQRPWAYGIVSMLAALLIGWGASFLFRRR